MLMWRLSANLMSNGVSLAVKPGNTGSGTRITPKQGGVLAYTFGPRTDETCRELLALLTPFNIGMLTSDDWGSYGREVPKDKHLTGKIFTQRIERNNLTLRTRIKRLARKTICFSRSVEIHEKVIGTFIEKHMFY
ncbi:iso-IS1 ORF2 [Shigella dysenteriae]|uniref:Iso-IS1 ORF2 n=1 Tax=Shigella dysenteriae TaxID=622 RepID=A0A2X2HI82_SHIDY|nr:iso-IS1 ORF2 [Shigella dysenteriae]